MYQLLFCAYISLTYPDTLSAPDILSLFAILLSVSGLLLGLYLSLVVAMKLSYTNLSDYIPEYFARTE